MENGGIKNIVLIALVVVLSFFIGSLAVDGWKDALMPIAVIVAAFIMLYLGKNSKYLIFYLPAIFPLLPFSVGYADMTSIVICGLFAYWIFLRFMGYIRFKWSSLWAIDITVLVLFLYGCVTFYRHPVAAAGLGLETDMMGGADYIVILTATIAYIAISLIPFTAKELCKAVYNTFFLGIGVSIIMIFRGMPTGGEGEGSSLAEEMQGTRFTLFASLGRTLFLFLYAFYPFRKIICSPLKLSVLLLCTLAVFLSGWRSTIIPFVLSIAVIAFYKRELSFLIALGGFVYAGLLFLSSEHAYDELPFGIQRSLCAIPGVHVSKAVEADAEVSSEWRKEMWQWALDPRTGYIKDYVWGDGPGLSQAASKRRYIAMLRGTIRGGDNKNFAAQGLWHSGWITMMHRFGIIGLVLTVITQLLWIVYATLACLRYRSTTYFPYLCVYFSAALPYSILYHLSAGLPGQIFANLVRLALCKHFYLKAKEIGDDVDFFRTKPYIPLMIREIDKKEEQQPSLANS